jgi:hypothetical protein
LVAAFLGAGESTPEAPTGTTSEGAAEPEPAQPLATEAKSPSEAPAEPQIDESSAPNAASVPGESPVADSLEEKAAESPSESASSTPGNASGVAQTAAESGEAPSAGADAGERSLPPDTISEQSIAPPSSPEPQPIAPADTPTDSLASEIISPSLAMERRKVHRRRNRGPHESKAVQADLPFDTDLVLLRDWVPTIPAEA